MPRFCYVRRAITLYLEKSVVAVLDVVIYNAALWAVPGIYDVHGGVGETSPTNNCNLPTTSIHNASARVSSSMTCLVGGVAL